ncbi:MAG TPA: UbiA family prenyltransferase, partial [Streptosporangiaceae bacterium]|nr:UbiA family prenyltransferase [Streptosporangiaceae bacterium]
MSTATSAVPAGGAGSRSARDLSLALLTFTQPRIIELLLVTAIPAMLVAQRGLPPARTLLLTLSAEALAAGSASTITSCAGRGMRGRPPLIRPAGAVILGLALGAAATVLLGVLASWLSAALADAAIAMFVLIGTLRTRRGPPSGTIAVTVTGAAAACFPVLTGWSVVTGALSPLAILLLAAIFCWAPPRLWALAMEFRSSWPAARPPALTAVTPAAARTIGWYSAIMVAATFGLAPYGGWVYTVSAVWLGAWFLAESCRLRARARHVPGSAPVTASTGAAGLAGARGLSIACLAQFLAVVLALALLPPAR